jgi:hypothetical protein
MVSKESRMDRDKIQIDYLITIDYKRNKIPRLLRFYLLFIRLYAIFLDISPSNGDWS